MEHLWWRKESKSGKSHNQCCIEFSKDARTRGLPQPGLWDHPARQLHLLRTTWEPPRASLIVLSSHTIWKCTVTYFRLCYVLAHSTVNRNSILQAQRVYPEPLIRNVLLNQGAGEELSSLEAFRDV